MSFKTESCPRLGVGVGVAVGVVVGVGVGVDVDVVVGEGVGVASARLPPHAATVAAIIRIAIHLFIVSPSIHASFLNRSISLFANSRVWRKLPRVN